MTYSQFLDKTPSGLMWVYVILGVIAIIAFALWLTSKISIWTSIYITIVLNFIVSCYLAYEKYKK